MNLKNKKNLLYLFCVFIINYSSMKTLMSDFRDFLIKGNAIDLAVGFMFGAAFATVVNSFVNNVIMPPIGLLLGKVDFSNLFIALDGNTYTTLAALEEA